jgi:hypothetical protein
LQGCKRATTHDESEQLRAAAQVPTLVEGDLRFLP